MGKVAVDFGTGNTVLARVNETTGQTETLQIPEITKEYRYRLKRDGPVHVVHLAPSLIHYSETETLIGDQVVSRGLAEHRDTVRWMKRGIAHRVTRRKKTPQGHKSPAQAGEDFLTLLLNYASDRISLADDEFTFTSPVEAFEDFQDWVRRVCEAVGIRRMRMLDEPTACVLGYQGAARKDDRFLVFDFGCGTLDVAAVRIDPLAQADVKAFQLGQAGRDLGGMDIDRWIGEDFCERHRLADADRRQYEAAILRQAEAAKIDLSRPGAESAEVTVLLKTARAARILRTAYRPCCPECERGRVGEPRNSGESCLGCLLLAKNFSGQVRETLDRAIENAAVHAGMRRDDVVRVLATGGTTLVPCVRRILHDMFGTRVALQSPFDAVVRGACRGMVAPILQHDYAIESYSRESEAYVFEPLYKQGTEYPTDPRSPVRLWARGAYDGMVKIGLKIYEVSQVKRVPASVGLFDKDGVVFDESHVATDRSYVCLNRDNPTFITADPPVNLERDQSRFLCSFRVDGHRRLRVTVLDNFGGTTPMKDYPVVRL